MTPNRSNASSLLTMGSPSIRACAASIRSKGLDATKGIQAFLKVHPGKSYATYVNNGRDYSELQQWLAMQVVALVERAK